MKHILIPALAILLLAATGWGETIQTNIQATIRITVTTNTFAPKQYWQENNYINCDAVFTPCVNVQTTSGSGHWNDSPEPQFIPQWWGGQSSIRDNPDVRITEVHEVKTVSFKCDGIPVRVTLYNKILSTVTEDRVETTETTTKDGCKVTTTVEQWKRREP